ncbi:hypothetical protein [Cytobacillus praedii]|uniref:hypothetical protein n=1 Tax=Cytobacillus praedii TaxID=1742358 RepID=UPI002E1FD4AC|nr:hypothetical protein [Cytobacillus praedii]
MLLYILNLILTYVFALIFSGSVFTFFMIKGNIPRKIQGLLIGAIPLGLLFYWGINIDSKNYIWWFLGIVIWNIIAQARHIQKRIKMNNQQHM